MVSHDDQRPLLLLSNQTHIIVSISYKLALPSLSLQSHSESGMTRGMAFFKKTLALILTFLYVPIISFHLTSIMGVPHYGLVLKKQG